MPRSTANPSNKGDSKADSNRQLGPTSAQQEKAKIRKLKNIIENYMSASAQNGRKPSEDWRRVEADLAKIDLKDISKASEAMRELNIRATDMFINELESEVARANEKGKDAKTIQKLENNVKQMKCYQGEPVYATVIRHIEEGKEESEVD